jgi:hypothetical protein
LLMHSPAAPTHSYPTSNSVDGFHAPGDERTMRSPERAGEHGDLP